MNGFRLLALLCCLLHLLLDVLLAAVGTGQLFLRHLQLFTVNFNSESQRLLLSLLLMVFVILVGVLFKVFLCLFGVEFNFLRFNLVRDFFSHVFNLLFNRFLWREK